jgi:HAMP domain-containing protein
VTRALGSLVLWTSLLLAGIAAVTASGLFVSRRIVLPLEALRRAMLALAENDLATPLPRFARMDEVGEMSDALRSSRRMPCGGSACRKTRRCCTPA